jgi:hypothetical protein
LNFHRLTIGFGLWKVVVFLRERKLGAGQETVGMAKKYVPKIDDPVFVDSEGRVRFVVTDVNATKETADIKTVSGVTILYRGIPWSKLQYLDESQNALQVVREATEDH